MNPFIHIGIVVQNNDPEKAGRVKVFVPGITNTVYDNWNNKITNKEFSFTTDESIKAILDNLREDLPWAIAATSIFGGDTNKLDAGGSSKPLERPSDGKVKSPPSDSFGASNYTPGDYSGTAAGYFSIPSVGSHVHIYFKDGDVSFPVYFAANHDIEEWQNIFKDNYPDGDSAPHQNKHVINTSKHTLEFIDTDNSEEIKLSHSSGSNVQLLNDYSSKYTVKDDYTLVDGSGFETIKGDLKVDIGGNEEIAVGGDETITVGGDETITVGGSITITAGASITITNGAGTIEIDPGGNITITGTTINLN